MKYIISAYAGKFNVYDSQLSRPVFEKSIDLLKLLDYARSIKISDEDFYICFIDNLANSCRYGTSKKSLNLVETISNNECGFRNSAMSCDDFVKKYLS